MPSKALANKTAIALDVRSFMLVLDQMILKV